MLIRNYREATEAGSYCMILLPAASVVRVMEGREERKKENHSGYLDIVVIWHLQHRTMQCRSK